MASMGAPMAGTPPTSPTVREAMHVCVVCEHAEPVDVFAYVAGARVFDGRVAWFCERHRSPSPSPSVPFIDCPAAPYYGD